MNHVSPIPVVIVGGYLGSGKTTLINACLQNGLRNAAIIVNDFGDINIDVALISQYSSDTLELTNGCICCSIGDSLADTLFSILDRPQLPDVIIIETSGASDPASVAAYTNLKGLTNAGIVVLVDAVQAVKHFNEPLIKRSLERQIRSAHLLALTKTDISSPEQRQSVVNLLHELAPRTQVVEASLSALVQLIDTPFASPSPVPSSAEEHMLVSSTHHFDNEVTLEQLHDYLTGLGTSVVRVKGIVELHDGTRVLVQKTGALVSVTTTNVAPTGLVLLATH